MPRDAVSGPRTSPPDQALHNYLQIDLLRLFAWLRMKVRWIIGAALVGLLLGVCFSLFSTPRYVVTSQLLVDPAGLRMVSNDLYDRSEQRDTQLLNADSQLQTLLSRNVLMRVVEKLDLASDPEFAAPSATVSPAIAALDTLTRRISARRDERSFVIVTSIWTRDVQKSIRISETLISEFKAELSAADADGAGRMTSSLMERLVELKASVGEAEEAVETFRREADLLSSQGELSSSRSMSQVDTQLRDARQRLIAAQSRHSQLVSGGADTTAIQSPTLSALRTQQAGIKQTADRFALTYGSRHPRYLAAQLELTSIGAEISAEITRLVAAAENEVVQAQAVVTALEKELTAASTDVFSGHEAQVRLRELTREASARSAVYEAFLSRARMTAEREQVDTTNVRVISSPLAPRSRSWPPSVVQSALFGFVAGLTLGAIGVLGFGIVSDIRRPPEPMKGQAEVEPQPLPEPIPEPKRAEPARSLLSLIPRDAPYAGRRL